VARGGGGCMIFLSQRKKEEAKFALRVEISTNNEVEDLSLYKDLLIFKVQRRAMEWIKPNPPIS